MTSAPVPENEDQRLTKLREYDILDTTTEQDYDDIARLVTQICGTELSTISFVDRDRQWFKAAVGISGQETSRDVAFCAHTILGDELFTVEDASADPRFDDNPLVTIDPQLRFYAGMPLITPDGFRLGALCAIDRSPRKLTPEQEETLRILARHVVDLLELRRSRRMLEEQNRELREVSDLKSRLMSIIAHDVRSPMASISSIMSLFGSEELSEDEESLLLQELRQVIGSTQYLLDNVIGWASRSLDTSAFQFSRIDLHQLALELTESMRHEVQKKGNTLLTSLPETETWMEGDRNVLVFVLRNLLVNANKFTSQGTITLGVTQDPTGTSVFTVSDTGIGMSEDQIQGLFNWGVRSNRAGTGGEKGAGLALLFCHDFIQRLGGTITVTSATGTATAEGSRAAAGTTFTVTVPAAEGSATGAASSAASSAAGSGATAP